jgi:hypothetical protein
MAPKRDRFAKSSDVLCDVLSEFALGPWWLKYPEHCKSGIQKSTVTNHGPLLVKLRDLQPNLSFTKTACVRAFTTIVNHENAMSWPLTDDERADWITKMEKRLRVLCRHVAQCILKTKRSGSKTHWLLKLFDKKDLDSKKDSDSGNTKDCDSGNKRAMSDDDKADDKADPNDKETVIDLEDEEEEEESEEQIEDASEPEEQIVDDDMEGGDEAEAPPPPNLGKPEASAQACELECDSPSTPKAEVKGMGKDRGRGSGRGQARGRGSQVHTKF